MAQRKGALQSGPQLKLGPNRTSTSSSKRERRAPEPGSKDDTLKTGSLAPQPAASRSIAEAIGTQVRDLRRKLDLTGAELADQAGLSAGMNGKLVEQAPRNVLKRVVADAAAKGYTLKTGVECEFFLISPDGSTISDTGDHQSKPCYDQQALMRRYDVISEICDSMLELGWNPYQNDHEDANGQFEMNWQYDDALKTADKHAFFKYMDLPEKLGREPCRGN